MNATNLQLKFAPAFACGALLASSLLASHAQAAEFVDASEVGDGLPGTGRQLLELTVCVRESAGALVPASRAGGPMTARNYVEDELEELQRQLFELTQGKLVLRHADVMYDGDNATEDGCGAIQGKKVDIDWRLTMDPFCISGADPGEVATTCSSAATERSIQDATARAERSADPLVDGAGHLPCDTWQHGTDHVALWGTAVDLNALGEDNDFGAESVAHELGHYLFCLEDAYASPDWNPSYYTGNLWRWFNKQDDHTCVAR